MKYYLVKLLTNTQGQDGSAVAGAYDDSEKAIVAYHNLCASLHNASDVLYAIVQIVNELGNVEIMEIVNHKPQPEPTPEPEPETTEGEE